MIRTSNSRAPCLEYLSGGIWGSTFSLRLSESITLECAKNSPYGS